MDKIANSNEFKTKLSDFKHKDKADIDNNEERTVP